jgi:hypothetical protein
MGARDNALNIRRALCALIVVAAAAAFVLPATASASSRELLRDCADDGKLDHHYSQRELRQAERDVPSDIDEYTDCRDAIRSAQISGGRGGHGGGGTGGNSSLRTSSGAVAGSPQDLGELKRITEQGGAPTVDVGGRRVEAGGDGLFAAAGAANKIPAPVAAALIALAALGAAGGVLLLRRRRPEALAGIVGAGRAAFRPLSGARRVALRLFRR